MLEKLAREMYKYVHEVKFYILATMALFASAAVYAYYQRMTGNGGDGTLILFLGVFGNAIMWGFNFCIYYMCYLYAFHPKLNGKSEKLISRMWITRHICLITATVNTGLVVVTVCPPCVSG